MTRILTLAALAALFLTTAPALAGPIDRACMSSPRQQKSAQLCRCIQQAADRTLSRGEQRKAARFFSDPHKAQEVRQSNKPSDSSFWKRYRGFGDTAEAMCS